MNGIKQFIFLYKNSYEYFINNFAIYKRSFFALVCIDFLSFFPWQMLGVGENSLYEIIANLLGGVLSLVVVVEIILIEKNIHLFNGNKQTKENLLYSAPTYLISTLYTSLFILLGFIFFVIPGFFVAIYLSMVPLASLLTDGNENLYKLSYKITKKKKGLVISFILASLFLEIPNLLFNLIPSWEMRWSANALYSIFNAFLLVLMASTSTRLFYFLYSENADLSQQKK